MDDIHGCMSVALGRMPVATVFTSCFDLPIVDVASYSGYHEASWFSSRFRQWAGNSPRAYRNTVRTKLFD